MAKGGRTSFALQSGFQVLIGGSLAVLCMLCLKSKHEFFSGFASIVMLLVFFPLIKAQVSFFSSNGKSRSKLPLGTIVLTKAPKASIRIISVRPGGAILHLVCALVCVYLCLFPLDGESGDAAVAGRRPQPF